MKFPHEKLADDLMKAGLHEMSLAAAQYRYHDFRSPLEMPSTALAQELVNASRGVSMEKRDAIIEIYRCHMRGEYDATKAESDAWAASGEGQAAYAQLWRGGGKGED